MLDDPLVQLWDDVDSMVSQHVPPRHAAYVSAIIRGTARDVTRRFYDRRLGETEPQFEKAAMDAFAKLAANVIRFSPPECHDALTRELPRVLERVIHGYRVERRNCLSGPGRLLP